MITDSELLFRLILSAVIGGSIGIEREVRNRAAGLRTHILVSVGSTLIMLVSIYGFENNADPSRLASQVVSGIGFLGAGTILRTGNGIKGLTTAASLWVCAGIGLAIGAGYYLGGVITSFIVLISLIALGSVERKVAKNTHKIIHVIGDERPGLIGDIGTLFGQYYVAIKDISISEIEDSLSYEHKLDLRFIIKVPNGMEINNMVNYIYRIDNVDKVIYDGEIINREIT